MLALVGSTGWAAAQAPSPAICARDDLRASRQEFEKLYKAREYGRALSSLEPAFERCESALTVKERARILGDLSIAAYRAGDKKRCLEFIDRVPALGVDNAVAVAIEHNRRLCAGQVSLGDETAADCRNPKTSDEEALCGSALASGAAERLDRIEKLVKAHVRASAGKQAGPWLAALKKASTAWARLTEHDCEDLFTLEFGPWGTGFNSEQMACRLDMTKRWMAELQNHFALPGSASQERPAPVACVTTDPFKCPALVEADEALNLAFKRALSSDPPENEQAAALPAKLWKPTLRKSQKLWLQWRDLWCGSALDAELDAQSSSPSSAERAGRKAACLAGVSHLRTARLRQDSEQLAP